MDVAMKFLVCAIFLGAITSVKAADRKSIPSENLLVITAATRETDGFTRFMRTARQFNYTVKVLGLGEDWKGGDVARTVGGGQKVRWLKEEMEQHAERDELVVMFVDRPRAVTVTPGCAGSCVRFKRLILKSLAEVSTVSMAHAGFNYSGALITEIHAIPAWESEARPTCIRKALCRFNHRVVFSAEGFCWPDQKLASKYPPVYNGKRYLNSGGFIGYATDLSRLVQSWSFRDDDDDQLFYTNIYLDQVQRSWSFRDDDDDQLFYTNIYLDQVQRLQLNYLGNYVPSAWTHEGGCEICNDDLLDLTQLQLQLNYLGNYVPSAWTHEGGCEICNDDLLDLTQLQHYGVVYAAFSDRCRRCVGVLESRLESCRCSAEEVNLRFSLSASQLAALTRLAGAWLWGME
ncbi:Procollagen-lysine,2-oxoglutarate 5-dioxygenase 3 [Acipenser ruthenus]|uniref:Procollagen-lysine,2-oxoglutarate 5-dioxygenase 3 n=1 Tax=Acipenser ruthenus TaxID=7906 RepID=A0A444UX15_ACIRT|nr:Procollagen-lysine,2-oxoglutarate 5-dioxygenase 3 [Acipenser ruthenus]